MPTIFKAEHFGKKREQGLNGDQIIYFSNISKINIILDETRYYFLSKDL